MFFCLSASSASVWTRLAGAGVAAAIAASSALAQNPPLPPETGVWIDHTGKGAVEVAPCGAKLCGRIFWLKEPNTPKGQPLVDAHNPEASKKKRAICGLPVLGNLQRQAGGSWDLGWIYDPKEGKSYDLEIKAAGRDRLAVTGYLGTKFFGKTMIWTRAKPDLAGCGAAPQTNVAAKKAAPPAQPNSPAGKSMQAAAAKPGGAPAQRAALGPSLPKRTESDSPAAPGAQSAAKAPVAYGPAPATKETVTKPPLAGMKTAAREVAPIVPNFSQEPVLVSGPVPAKRPAANGKAPAVAPAEGTGVSKRTGRFEYGPETLIPPRR